MVAILTPVKMRHNTRLAAATEVVSSQDDKSPGEDGKLRQRKQSLGRALQDGCIARPQRLAKKNHVALDYSEVVLFDRAITICFRSHELQRMRSVMSQKVRF